MSATSRDPMLAIRDLSVAFRSGGEHVHAVREVTLDVMPGQTLAVVGQSGSGKSTMAAAVNRLLPENGEIISGEILFDGVDLVAATEAKLQTVRGAGIGLVPQDPMSNLNPMMRVGAQVVEALEVHGRASGNAALREAIKLFEMVGIADPEQRVNQYPHEFSGGMRQRVLIAMGLACRPRLLIADEPTSALDVTVQRKILDELEVLTDEMGTSVFLITHDLGLAAERADIVAVMHEGRIVEQGRARDILQNPQHEYTRRLLDAAPSLNTRSIAVEIESDEADNIVEVRDVSKVFEIRAGRSGRRTEFTAVDSVSFAIPRGHTVSIVGESGSGKSTTANMILGLEPITTGKIMLNGTDIATFGKREFFDFRRQVQPVFQNPYASLDPRYTVGRTVAEPMAVHRIGSESSRNERMKELLEQVALPAGFADRFPHELSGGQRQRVAIARALSLSPELVVLDEAVSALDVLVQDQILELLVELQRELNLSYLFISHDLAVVRMISHFVHVMQHGRIVESGTPDELFTSPRSAYTRELIAAIPSLQNVA